MVLLRDGSSVDDPRLDRLRSETTEHLEKYPLTASSMPQQETVQVFGTNFYTGMYDTTVRTVRGVKWHFWPEPANLGRLVGGHAYVLRPWGSLDTASWWRYYDQGVEGRCTEFAVLRALTLHNRRRYDITSRWHYWESQRTDEWPGGSYPGVPSNLFYEGSSVRAALEVIRAHGAIRARRNRTGYISILPESAGSLVLPGEGIQAYRWVPDWQTARQLAGVPDWFPGIPMLNSWGESFAHHNVVPDATGERLLREQGELGVIADR
jgi:hypothetical protein